MTEPETHAVSRAVLDRRSWRVYTGARPSEEAVSGLLRLAGLAPSVRGRGSASVHLASEPSEVAELTRAITSGFVGKVNLWLKAARPGAYAVLIGDAGRAARSGDRMFFNVDVAVAGELVALGATTFGLGSCWMAAIDAGAIRALLGLGPDRRVPAVLALGEPGLRRNGSLLAASWDRVTQIAVSRRRTALRDLVSDRRFGSELPLEPVDLARLPSDGRSLEAAVADLAPSARFGGQAPDRRSLAEVLEAMRLAPSADNAQTWRFVVVEGRDAVRRALEAARLEVEDRDAPALLVALLAAPFIFKRARREEPFALIDHPIALSHAVLVAEASALRWSVAFDLDHERLAAHLGAPADHELTAVLALDREGEGGEPPWPGLLQLHR